MSGDGGPDPDPVSDGKEFHITVSNPKSLAAAAAVGAEETGSFSVEDEKAHVGAVAQEPKAVADVKEADDDGDDGATVMSWTEFVVAYKRLSEEEVNFILSRPRKPFESTALYKDMIADSSTTKEDLEREAADHEYAEDNLSKLRKRVRKEYAEKGFVAMDDEAIANRLELEQYFNETWSTMFSELGLDDNMFTDEGT